MNSYLLISLAAVLGGFALWIIYRGLASTVRDSSRASQDMAARLDEQIRAVQREVKDTLAASHAQQLLQLQDSQRILNESLGERLEKSSQNIHRQLAVVPEVQKKLGELEEQARNMARIDRKSVV